MNEIITRTTRFSSADWATELRDIHLIGLGGIGSYVAYNLARIGHNLVLIDGDVVDETNVNGGQLYRTTDIGKFKVDAIKEICRQFGAIDGLEAFSVQWNKEEFGNCMITICGLDNMKSRKEIFESWISEYKGCNNSLFIDGRLLIENMEIFTIVGDNTKAIEDYETNHLFDDNEVADLDCTSKQSSFGAMTIAGLITATLCNFLTNKKLDVNFRNIPFHQKLYLPLFKYDIIEPMIAEEAFV